VTESSRILAVICARGGSKGLPGKNLLPLGGKPLIAWSLEAALAAERVDAIAFSSDSEDMLRLAGGYDGVTLVRRPPELASDDADIADAILHAVDAMDGAFGYVVLLQPTSPFRTGADIDAAIEQCQTAGADSCVSVCAPGKSPFWMYTLNSEGRMRQLIDAPHHYNRQHLPEVWALNGAVYVARTDWFRQSRQFVGEDTLAYAMPAARSIDIDSEMDLRIAEALLTP
jgi:CMP-N,N'-diacetyllegionaminic acid synthase